MKKVFLRFYDLQNLGDDLFLHIITTRYLNKFTIISKSPTKVMDLPNIIVYSNKISILFFRFIEKFIYPKNLLLNKLINKNDLYVYIGGSLFIDNGDTKHWNNELKFYQQLKTPYYILGSNFGPYKTQQYVQLVKKILVNAKDVCFRDKASLDVFKDLANVRVSTDIAFTLDIKPYQKKTKKLAVFSIINCENRFETKIFKRYRQEIIKLSERLIDSGYQVIYMSFCKTEGDEIAIERILSEASNATASKIKTYNYSGNLDEALNLISEAEIIVGGRFHATVLGLLFSKKVIPMAYSDKTINLLKDLSYEGRIIDIRKINSFNGNKFNFNKIPIYNVQDSIKLAESQFSELDKVLEKSHE